MNCEYEIEGLDKRNKIVEKQCENLAVHIIKINDDDEKEHEFGYCNAHWYKVKSHYPTKKIDI